MRKSSRHGDRREGGKLKVHVEETEWWPVAHIPVDLNNRPFVEESTPTVEISEELFKRYLAANEELRQVNIELFRLRDEQLTETKDHCQHSYCGHPRELHRGPAGNSQCWEPGCPCTWYSEGQARVELDKEEK